MPTLKLLLVLFLIHLSNLLPAQTWQNDREIQQALAEVNRMRAAAGLNPVVVSEDLSQGCFNHARYLVLNMGNMKTAGLDAHKEFPELKGYTESGAQAGRNSVICYSLPSSAVSEWEATFYHRVPLLQPGLTEVGIGYYLREGKWPVSLIDCVSRSNGDSDTAVVFYPAALQDSVPVSMGSEIPNPMGKYGNYGFPITIYFAKWKSVKDVKFRLLAGPNQVVPCRISTPEKPATSFSQWSSICAIPERPLEYDQVYVYEVACTLNGEPFSRKVKFKTVPEGE